MTRLFVYVDNSNIWIEGMRFSAVQQGMVGTFEEAFNRSIVDHSWSYDFGELYRIVGADGSPIGRASLFGSRPPQNDSLWSIARRNGFDPIVFDRNFSNKEKQVDNAISVQMIEDSFIYMKRALNDRVVLVSGDRDHLPAIESLKRRGFPVGVVFWEHATSMDLRAAADEFVSLAPHFNQLTRERSGCETGPTATPETAIE